MSSRDRSAAPEGRSAQPARRRRGCARQFGVAADGASGRTGRIQQHCVRYWSGAIPAHHPQPVRRNRQRARFFGHAGKAFPAISSAGDAGPGSSQLQRLPPGAAQDRRCARRGAGSGRTAIAAAASSTPPVAVGIARQRATCVPRAAGTSRPAARPAQRVEALRPAASGQGGRRPHARPRWRGRCSLPHTAMTRARNREQFCGRQRHPGIRLGHLAQHRVHHAGGGLPLPPRPRVSATAALTAPCRASSRASISTVARRRMRRISGRGGGPSAASVRRRRGRCGSTSKRKAAGAGAVRGRKRRSVRGGLVQRGTVIDRRQQNQRALARIPDRKAGGLPAFLPVTCPMRAPCLGCQHPQRDAETAMTDHHLPARRPARLAGRGTPAQRQTTLICRWAGRPRRTRTRALWRLRKKRAFASISGGRLRTDIRTEYPGNAETGPFAACKAPQSVYLPLGLPTERCGNTRTTGNGRWPLAQTSKWALALIVANQALAQAGPGGRKPQGPVEVGVMTVTQQDAPIRHPCPAAPSPFSRPASARRSAARS